MENAAARPGPVCVAETRVTGPSDRDGNAARDLKAPCAPPVGGVEFGLQSALGDGRATGLEPRCRTDSLPCGEVGPAAEWSAGSPPVGLRRTVPPPRGPSPASGLCAPRLCGPATRGMAPRHIRRRCLRTRTVRRCWRKLMIASSGFPGITLVHRRAAPDLGARIESRAESAERTSVRGKPARLGVCAGRNGPQDYLRESA
jgi:hypothetical protein